MSRLPRAAICAFAVGLALGCRSHPEPASRCQSREAGASLEVDCVDDPNAAWSREALEEAEESMEERRPGGRR